MHSVRLAFGLGLLALLLATPASAQLAVCANDEFCRNTCLHPATQAGNEAHLTRAFQERAAPVGPGGLALSQIFDSDAFDPEARVPGNVPPQERIEIGLVTSPNDGGVVNQLMIFFEGLDPGDQINPREYCAYLAPLIFASWRTQGMQNMDFMIVSFTGLTPNADGFLRNEGLNLSIDGDLFNRLYGVDAALRHGLSLLQAAGTAAGPEGCGGPGKICTMGHSLGGLALMNYLRIAEAAFERGAAAERYVSFRQPLHNLVSVAVAIDSPLDPFDIGGGANAPMTLYTLMTSNACEGSPSCQDGMRRIMVNAARQTSNEYPFFGNWSFSLDEGDLENLRDRDVFWFPGQSDEFNLMRRAEVRRRTYVEPMSDLVFWPLEDSSGRPKRTVHVTGQVPAVDNAGSPVGPFEGWWDDFFPKRIRTAAFSLGWQGCGKGLRNADGTCDESPSPNDDNLTDVWLRLRAETEFLGLFRTVVRWHFRSGIQHLVPGSSFSFPFDEDQSAATWDAVQEAAAGAGVLDPGDWNDFLNDALGFDLFFLPDIKITFRSVMRELVRALDDLGLLDVDARLTGDLSELTFISSHSALACSYPFLFNGHAFDRKYSFDLETCERYSPIDAIGVRPGCNPNDGGDRCSHSSFGMAEAAFVLQQVQAAAQEFGYIRGDVDWDGDLDQDDAVALLRHLFQGGPGTCHAVMDANRDGSVDIADAITILTQVFQGFLVVAPPWDPQLPIDVLGEDFDPAIDLCAAGCGNDIVEREEQCDPPQTGLCTNACRFFPATCEDGLLQQGEACDPTAANSPALAPGERCVECDIVTCGDGAVGPGEECDSPDDPFCRADCTLAAACGDGVLIGNETCDPGDVDAYPCDAATCQPTAPVNVAGMVMLADRFAFAQTDPVQAEIDGQAVPGAEAPCPAGGCRTVIRDDPLMRIWSDASVLPFQNPLFQNVRHPFETFSTFVAESLVEVTEVEGELPALPRAHIGSMFVEVDRPNDPRAYEVNFVPGTLDPITGGRQHATYRGWDVPIWADETGAPGLLAPHVSYFHPDHRWSLDAPETGALVLDVAPPPMRFVLTRPDLDAALADDEAVSVLVGPGAPDFVLEWDTATGTAEGVRIDLWQNNSAARHYRALSVWTDDDGRFVVPAAAMTGFRIGPALHLNVSRCNVGQAGNASLATCSGQLFNNAVAVPVQDGEELEGAGEEEAP